MANLLRQRWRSLVLHQHPIDGTSLQLTYRRIYILPTKRGAGFALVIVLGLIGAINYQLSLGFFFVFLLAGLANAALFRTWAALLGLEIQAASALPVFCSGVARFPLRLHDHAGRTRMAISLQSPSGCTQVANVGSFDSSTLTVDIPATRRGLLTLPRIRIECRAPTGWFVAWSHIHLHGECVIYPHPEENPPPLPSGSWPEGDSMAAYAGDDDFAGLREYQPSDSPRRIAWKQLARSDQLFSRHLQSQAKAEVVLDWHALPSLDTEARVSRLTAWVLLAESTGLRYALILPGLSLPIDHGLMHREQCLNALALYPSDQEDSRE